MLILTRDLMGRVRPMEVIASDTIATIKRRIINQIDLSDEFRVFVVFNRSQCLDPFTLADYEVTHESTVHYVFSKRPSTETDLKQLVKVRVDGVEHCLRFDREEGKVSELHGAISSELHILPEMGYTLVAVEPAGVALPGGPCDEKLSKFIPDTVECAIVELSLPPPPEKEMWLLIKTMHGDTLPLEANRDDTLRSVAATVDRLMLGTAIGPAQLLRADGTAYEDLDATLRSAGVNALDVVFVRLPLPRKLTVYVKTLTGATTTFSLEKGATCDNLRSLIEDRLGVPPSSQRILFSANPVEPETVLEEIGVQQHSVLHLVVRVTSD